MRRVNSSEQWRWRGTYTLGKAPDVYWGPGSVRMASLYSKRRFSPRERLALLKTGQALIIAAGQLRVGGSWLRRMQWQGAVVVAGAAVAAASYLPNRNTVHSGEYPRRTWRDYPALHLEGLFRFKAEEIPRLVAALELPSEVRPGNRRLFSKDDAITVLLLHLAGKNYHAIHRETGVHPGAISHLLNWTLDFIHERWYVRLLASDLQRWTPDFPAWAEAVFDKTDKLGFDDTPVFVDGTLREIAKPAHNQDVMFNGHHWTHGLVYQGLVAPNGLMIDLAGPMAGRRHDTALLAKSRLLRRWADALAAEGYAPGEYCVYGDAGYPRSPCLRGAYRPYANTPLSAAQTSLNGVMSTVRIAVEWGFGRVTALWPQCDFTRGQQLGRRPVAKMYIAAVILTNALTCLRGNQTSLYFQLQPPSLEDYFGQAPQQPAGRAQAWDETFI